MSRSPATGGGVAPNLRHPPTPALRIRRCNAAPVAGDGRFVLYWMIAARRTRWNFGLQRAVELGNELDLPLVVLEPLRIGYRWASERFHRFVVEGMADNAARCERSGVPYHPYVEPSAGSGSGLLETLAGRASAIVTDDFPAFFLPRMVEAAAKRVGVRVEAVDGNGLLPLRATEGPFATAYAFRRFLQRELPAHLETAPHPDPLSLLRRAGGRETGDAESIPRDVRDRWPAADLSDPAALVRALSVDRSVPAVAARGGAEAASRRAGAFVDDVLPRYADEANRPESEATSLLSPYLHFGHLSAHELFHRVAVGEGWTPARLASDARGRRSGWWGMSEGAEAYLDQAVTWRELGFVRCVHVDRYDAYEALPEWARETLSEHASDAREFVYDLDRFEAARTHDPLWNAAQRQLRREGRIHNYMRMLWGKKILEWSESPREALRVMFELNDKWALDGRDPNSATGILWILGLHDRPWGPERPIFGKVRYMSSTNTARKHRVGRYLARYGPDERVSERDTTASGARPV